MRAETPPRQEWLERRERGSVATIRLMVFIARRLGRSVARALLYPICFYFLVFSTGSRTASGTYLARALGRRSTLFDRFRHYHTFAACVLDRVFVLNEQMEVLDLSINGEEILSEITETGSGCLLFGAHIGSFEILRAIGHRRKNLRVSLVMYEENARKINSVLSAINPRLEMDIIALGRPTSMIEIGERLNAGAFVGVLADRSLHDEEQMRVSFLGTPAPFPVGPFRMAALLKRPVVLMVALYRGGRRYDVYFEHLIDPTGQSAEHRAAMIEEGLNRYVNRLEHYCRLAPYNWFNFYDFWR